MPIRKFFLTLKEHGWSRSIYKAAVYSMRKLGVKIPEEQVGLMERRNQLAKEINQLLGGTVSYGPFKGLKFVGESWWEGDQDRAAILLGLYEKDILDILERSRTKYSTLINLGAADGYYAVGALMGGLFEKGYCFEVEPKGREIIAQNAMLNGVKDKLKIFGAATNDFYLQIPSSERDRAVVIVDIEGAEFDVLTAEVFDAFTRSLFIVEIHDWVEQGEAKIKRLQESIPSNYTLTTVKMGARDLSQFEELKNYNDTDRWLICSEGRPVLMSWFVIEEREI